MTVLPRHRTARERRAQQSAQAAIARAHAHTRPAPAEDDFDLGRQYPYVTPARARQIRHELEETRRHG
jgi:hypothetical protein